MLYSKTKTRLHARGADRRASYFSHPRRAAHSRPDRVYRQGEKDQVIAETRMLHEAIQTEMVENFMGRIQTGNLLTKLLLPLHLLRTKQQSMAAHCCQMLTTL